MDTSEAEAILHHDTHADDGAYTRLRLGEYPGDGAINSLRSALQLVRRKYADEQSIPRGVAFSCGIILHFGPECLRNLKVSGASRDVLDAVHYLGLAAFVALAGNSEGDWGV